MSQYLKMKVTTFLLYTFWKATFKFKSAKNKHTALIIAFSSSPLLGGTAFVGINKSSQSYVHISVLQPPNLYFYVRVYFRVPFVKYKSPDLTKHIHPLLYFYSPADK